MFSDYNRRQNQLRHFDLNWAFLRFTDFKREKYSFSSPIPPRNVVPLFELPRENNKHPNFEWRGQGSGGLRVVPIFPRDSRASETRAGVKIISREKDARFARSTIL